MSQTIVKVKPNGTVSHLLVMDSAMDSYHSSNKGLMNRRTLKVSFAVVFGTKVSCVLEGYLLFYTS